MRAPRITVAYAGVHQAYEIALAAQELGQLQAFYCGVYDAPGKWGSVIANFVGHEALGARRLGELQLDKIREFPWPLVLKVIRDRLYTLRKDDWLAAYDAFDRWVARKLERLPPAIFVGTAACDLHSLRVAKAQGATLVHDCPGLHPGYLAELLREAADRAGLAWDSTLGVPMKWDARKLIEYSLADVLLVYSDIHRRSFEAKGFSAQKVFMSPLWVDTNFWRRPNSSIPEKRKSDPLKLLFVGPINLTKGVPFLGKAMEECGTAVHLTIVGARDRATDSILGTLKENIAFVLPQSKIKLREIYASHDVLVLPSVADSFGFVALEAMACGLPVIVTQNCGAPVPDESWRVPAMNSAALARRIMTYVDNPHLIVQHGIDALAFAREQTPQKYRLNIGTLLKRLLEERGAV